MMRGRDIFVFITDEYSIGTASRVTGLAVLWSLCISTAINLSSSFPVLSLSVNPNVTTTESKMEKKLESKYVQLYQM